MPAQTRRRAQSAPSPQQEAPSPSPSAQASNAQQAESLEPGIEAQAAEARATASALRKRAEEKLAKLEAEARPCLRSMPAWKVLRRELAPMLPPDITADEVLEDLGFEPETLGGVEARGIRSPKDPDRPSLLTFATAEGEKKLAARLQGYTQAKLWVEGRRIAGGLLGSFLQREEKPTHDPKPAIVVLFDGGTGLSEGLGIANEAINGEKAKDLTAGVATGRALAEAGSGRRLNKAATGEGLGGRIANRVFRKKLLQGRTEAHHEGQKAHSEGVDVVQAEVRASLLTAQAQVEGQMRAKDMPMDKLGIGVVFDTQNLGLAPDSLNFYCRTTEGRIVHLKDIGEAITYVKAANIESETGDAYKAGELSNERLDAIAAKQGLEQVETDGKWELRPQAARESM